MTIHVSMTNRVRKGGDGEDHPQDDNILDVSVPTGSRKEVNMKVLTVEKVVHNNCKHIVFVFCLPVIVLRNVSTLIHLTFTVTPPSEAVIKIPIL